MTTITVPRAVLEQALEALETISTCYVGDHDSAGECASCHESSYLPHAPDCKKQNAITALRAALAQQEQDTAVHMTHCNQGEWEGVCKYGEEDCPALAQQEQEPVARMHADGSGRIISQATYDEAQRQGGVPWSSVRRYTTPLYTHPPRREWQSLTEDEIRMAYGNDLKYRDGDYERFARAVEAKLKEKANG